MKTEFSPRTIFSSFCLLAVYLTPLVSSSAAAAPTCPTALFPQTPTGFSVTHCPPGWARYKQEKCFKIYVDAPKSQESAREFCQLEAGADADLASIHSLDEFEFLKSYALVKFGDVATLNHVWIGLVRRGTEWFWTDNSRLNYTNWWPSEPVAVSVKSCAIFVTYTVDPSNSGKFAAAFCTSHYGFMCQKYQVDSRVVNYKYSG